MKEYKKCTCKDISSNTIHKIASIPLSDRGILVVKKEFTDEYISLGGSHEGSETHEEALDREAQEELQVKVSNPEFMGRFQDVTEIGVPIIVDAYLVGISGEPIPSSEIIEYLWVDKNYQNKDIKIASILGKFVIPELVRRDLM